MKKNIASWNNLAVDNFIVENSSNYPAAVVVAAAVTAAPESNYAGCHHYIHSENLVSVNTRFHEASRIGKLICGS